MLSIKKNTKIGKKLIKTYRAEQTVAISYSTQKPMQKIGKKLFVLGGGGVTLSRTKVDSLYHQSYALAV